VADLARIGDVVAAELGGALGKAALPPGVSACLCRRSLETSAASDTRGQPSR
jgi:hypothetical protein